MNPWLERVCVVVLVLAATAGCADISLSIVARDPSGRGQGPFVQVGIEQGLVSVTRQGTRLAQAPSRLQAGDEVETGPDGVALIHFRDLGDVMLMPRTRVRIGSIEVIFGEFLAKVRGLFTASSQNVVAAVQGTSFSLSSSNGAVHIVVAEGVVSVSPRSGGWPAQRLGPGQALTVAAGGTGTPRVGPSAAPEIARLESRFDELRQAPRQGFCCVQGRVQPGQSDRCASNMFGRTEADAQRACHAAETGLCCRNGSLETSTRGDCPTAQFFESMVTARMYCQKPAQPVKVN
jgi:hypothetical protein